jgi:hypothetical protein
VLNTGECTATRDARAKALEPFAVAADTLWHVRSRKMRIAIALKSIFIVYSNPDLIPALRRANLVIERSSTIVLILAVGQTLAAGLRWASLAHLEPFPDGARLPNL